MPTWSNKDRRQYEHIKESAEQRGASEDRAQEIAARTVNKHRSEEGRAPSGGKSGKNDYGSAALSDRTVKELQSIAADKNIRGRSKMRKSELVKAIQNA